MGFKENLKDELTYSGMLVKELAAKSGVNICSLNGYLSKKDQQPCAETAVRIARALNVSVEYLVTGKEGQPPHLSDDALKIGRLAEQLNPHNRLLVLDFIEMLKARQ